MYTLESTLARLKIEDRIREANQKRLAHEFHRREQPSTTPTAVREPGRPCAGDPMTTARYEQVSDLKRLCFKHWLYLMLASLMDAPSPEDAIDQPGSIRMDVLGAALSCAQCKARNELYLPPAAPGDGRGSGFDGSDPLTPYELLEQQPTRGRFAAIRRVVAVVVIITFGVVAVATLVRHLANEPIASTGVDITSLAVGDCVRDMAFSDGFAPDFVDVVDCTRLHTDEVYATFTLRDGTYPGDQRVEALADRGCVKRFAAYVGSSTARTTLDIYFVTPSKESWSLDHDQGVLCTVGSPGHPTKGSVRHSGR